MEDFFTLFRGRTTWGIVTKIIIIIIIINIIIIIIIILMNDCFRIVWLFGPRMCDHYFVLTPNGVGLDCL